MPSTRDTDWRHRGWAPTRGRVRAALEALNVPRSRLDRFDQCGSDAWVAQASDNPDRLAVVCNRCHDRFCQPCAASRGRTIAANLAVHVQHADTRFITLTLRSTTEPLRDLLDALGKAWRDLRRTKLWRTTQDGGAAFIEITRGRRGDRWHVHLHIIVQGRYIPRAALSAAWLTCTGTSHIVDVRRVGQTDKLQAQVVRYVTKYASKGLDFSKIKDPDLLQEAIAALRGRKLVQTFGNLTPWNLTKPQTRTTWIRLITLHRLIEEAKDQHRAAIIMLAKLHRSHLADEDEANEKLNPSDLDTPPPEGNHHASTSHLSTVRL